MLASQLIIILVLFLLENSKATRDLLLIRKPNMLKRTKTLDDQQYQQMFQEMMRTNHEFIESSDEDDSKLKAVVGEDNLDVIKGVSRRRVDEEARSAAGRRRVRSQAIRREKLNSQSLRSHFMHVKRVRDTPDSAYKVADKS